MTEFLYNIWLGLLENKDEILMILGSTQFVSLLGIIVSVIRTGKRTVENTKSTCTLNESIGKTDALKSKVDKMDDGINAIFQDSTKLHDRIDNVESKLDDNNAIMNEKINAMLEVQTIVYASIKDERARNAVMSILSNAKYADAHTKEELKRQVEELKADVHNKSEELIKMVETRTDKVSAMVSPANLDTENEVVERY